MPLEQWSELTHRLRSFATERDWERFHSPKNLAMALTGEAGELAAEFQWLTEAQSQSLDPEQMGRVQEEAADVLLYLVRLADRLQFDLLEAAHRKIDLNAERYPVEKARGSAKKYTEY
jgi:dCTP diphosphatase